MEARAIN